MSNKFTPLQHVLYELMARTPNEDVNIATMWQAVYDANTRTPMPRETIRDMQQGLAPLIARVNAKLDGQRIEPGRLKQTYRLVKT